MDAIHPGATGKALRDDRLGERRRHRTFVLRERRSGFDRRSAGGGVLTQLRDHPMTLLILLAAVNVLNLLDQLATTRALDAGFSEGNPVMAYLISADPRLAATLKIAAVVGVSFGVWRLRRYRAILQVALFMFGVFAAVMMLHFWGSAFYF